jgi:diguanylate cyclase (GGDEF)-like protein
MARKCTNENGVLAILGLRWLFVGFAILLTIAGENLYAFSGILSFLIALILVYNGFVTLYVLWDAKNAVYSLPVLYTDAVFSSLLIYCMGGVYSDIYIYYFFIITFCGIKRRTENTVAFGVFCAAAYSISCIISYLTGAADFNLIRFIVRVLLIILDIILITGLCLEIERNIELRKREFKMAITDKLTGLANRHYLDRKIKEEIEFAQVTGSVINIMIFDLDNFKNFNDTYGHTWGDKLLVLFSDIIRQNIRKEDIPVRYGGEEFMLVVRELDIHMAKSVAERIRKQLEKQRLYAASDDERIHITVSCGIAQYPRHGTDIKQVIECADKALYYAKTAGKNSIIIYDEIKSF